MITLRGVDIAEVFLQSTRNKRDSEIHCFHEVLSIMRVKVLNVKNSIVQSNQHYQIQCSILFNTFTACARVSVIFQFFASFCNGKISHQQHKC